MSALRVGVVRGGPSSEYEVSLKTGAAVLKNLPEHYHPVDIFIDKEGVWHTHGAPRSPERIFRHVDVIFNALHGEYGEDGKIQALLDSHRVPYTGSDALSSAIGMNKALSKKIFQTQGIKTPYHVGLRKENTTRMILADVFRNFSKPVVVKPSSLGSSVGVSINRTFDEFAKSVDGVFDMTPSVVVEEYIQGREATCGVIEGFRDKRAYSLLPVEIIKPNSCEFFDYHAKYSGESREECPGNFSREESGEMQRMAVDAHNALGLRHYSRSDFIINPYRGIYILEVNTLPGLTEESLLPKSLQAIGSSFPEFLDHLISLALRK